MLKIQSILIAITATISACLTFLCQPVVNAQNNEALRNYYEQVTNNYQQELREARQEGSKFQEVDILNKAGLAYQYFGDFNQAVKLYQQAWEIAGEIDDFNRKSSTVRNLVNVHSNLGDYKGINFLTEQLEIATRSGNKQHQQIFLENLGQSYLATTNYLGAIEVYEQALQIVRELGNRQAQAENLRNLATANTGLQKNQRAIPLLQEALLIAKEINNQSLINSLMIQLGTAYNYNGDSELALATFQEVLQLAEKAEDTSNIWVSLKMLGLLYTALEDYDQVIAVNQRRLNISRETNNVFWEALDLEDLSGAYFWLGNYDKAIELQENSLKTYQSFARQSQQTSTVSEAQALEKLGFLYWKKGELNPAKKALLDSVDTYEKQRQQILANGNLVGLSSEELSSFAYESSSDIYRLLQQVLVSQNRSDEALVSSEKGRARAYVDFLVSRMAVDPSLQINAEPPNLEKIKQIARTENSTLVQYTVLYEYGRLYRYRFGKEQPHMKATGLLVWVIEPTGKISFRQVTFEKELETLVKNARNFITTKGRAFRVRKGEKSPLEELHTMLIEPIADLLPTNPQDRVTFIPQDTLFLVPFTALQDDEGTYLINKHTILTAPSIQVLDIARQMKNRATTGTVNLVVGNPTMPTMESTPGGLRQQLSSLPGAEAEAKQIAQLLDTQPLIGNAATEAAVIDKIQDARLIHLATHGLLDDTGGALSSLALAPNGEDDGFLTAVEIADLKLKAELAVLSACDTGRGKITGDGVVGLSRSFINAGAPSVLVSLWAIPDEPTAKLMGEFYQNLDNGVDKATALRQATLTTREQFPHPKAWAAFSLIGVVE